MTRAHECAEEIERQAAEWIIRIDLHGTPDNWAALDAWLAANPRHRAAFLRLSVFWKRADRLRELAPTDRRVDEDLLASMQNVVPADSDTQPFEVAPTQARIIPFQRHLPEKREQVAAARAWAETRNYRTSSSAISEGGRFRYPANSRVAASLAFAVVACGAALAWYVVGRNQADIYSTQVGEIRRITLDDGSSVALNTDSEVHVRYTERGRHVDLVRGEALFEVAKNPHRPFDVEAGQADVHAIGTAFSVRLHEETQEERVDVVVSEGRITINPPASATYTAGTVAIVRNGRVTSTSTLSGEDVSGKLAWVSGRLVFRGEKLDAVVAEINRYNHRHLEVSDPEIAGLRIGGTFNPSDPDGFVEALDRTFGIKARLAASGDKIELHSGVP
jgi:transmembrane sensor